MYTALNNPGSFTATGVFECRKLIRLKRLKVFYIFNTACSILLRLELRLNRPAYFQLFFPAITQAVNEEPVGNHDCGHDRRLFFRAAAFCPADQGVGIDCAFGANVHPALFCQTSTQSFSARWLKHFSQ